MYIDFVILGGGERSGINTFLLLDVRRTNSYRYTQVKILAVDFYRSMKHDIHFTAVNSFSLTFCVYEYFIYRLMDWRINIFQYL